MRSTLCRIAVVGVLFSGAVKAGPSPTPPSRVHSLKITVLDTPVGNLGVGEWGFSALVEADGHRILYDTGARTDVVLRNAREMKVDLTTIADVVLSHNHPDHVGGLATLRQSVKARTPDVLARAYVGEGIFSSAFPALKVVRESNAALLLKPEYEKAGGVFIVLGKPMELYPGVWLTGPVPRNNEPMGGEKAGIHAPPGWDIIPEDMALVCDTDDGLVVMTGCGHAGVINLIAYAQTFIRPARVHALIGGLHLNDAKEDTLAWTAEKLRSFGVDNLLGTHCSGFETVSRFRHDLGLDATHAAVAVVGSRFELGKGIDRLVAQ